MVSRCYNSRFNSHHLTVECELTVQPGTIPFSAYNSATIGIRVKPPHLATAMGGMGRCPMRHGYRIGTRRPHEESKMKIDVKGDVLTITLDVSKAAYDAAIPSASGKTKIVDSTHGFTGVVTPAGLVSLSLNATRK